MKSNWLWSGVLVLSCLSLIHAHAQDSYALEFQRGMKAYQDFHYEEATERFRRAIEIDPGQIDAHLYLASSCTVSYIPGVETKDNLEIAEEAIAQYQFALKLDPPRDVKVESLTQIATIYFNLRKWDEARKYYQMASDHARNDPENYYAIGVIDWVQCYQRRRAAREPLGIRSNQHLSSKNPAQKKICAELRSENSATIEEGIGRLNKAIELRPDYDDAMAYMNLMYRERVDLDCDDPKAQDKDLKAADEWVDKTIATKKARQDRAADESKTKGDTAASGQRFRLPLPPHHHLLRHRLHDLQNPVRNKKCWPRAAVCPLRLDFGRTSELAGSAHGQLA